jgi:menaquinone-dependent protoporphyrinogen IX oxidase
VTGPDLRVLLTSASRHGATREIAEALAARLRTAPGLSAVAIPVEHRPDPTGYGAVVLGSAVYAGHWLDPARDWAAAHAGMLRRGPVWLFSSGPIGEPPFPPDEPYDAAPIARLVDARGHAVFPGRLDKALLTFAERAVVTAMRAPVGDFRDWGAVEDWADGIARELTGVHPAPASTAP